MEEKRETRQPRVPFGHPGLEIRHPLRGLGGKLIDSINIMPIAFDKRQLFRGITAGILCGMDAQPHPPQSWGGRSIALEGKKL